MVNRSQLPASVDSLIIGAGPFGLAVAAAIGAERRETMIAGEAMSFWRDHMPEGMLLRSGPDWHLDPMGEFTFERFLAEARTSTAAASPITRDMYLEYVAWFQMQRGIDPIPVTIDRLDAQPDGRFHATLTDGQSVSARNVVLALGMGCFAHIPLEISRLVPPGRGDHTGDLVEFGALRGKRVLIIGGRQSAFEWAALVREAGATEVHVSHRHASPAFAESDWSWVSPMVEGMGSNPGWFRTLPHGEQEAIARNLWVEGRLKIEPWLEPRVLRDGIRLWPNSQLDSCQEHPSGELEISLDTGDRFTVDHVVFATGYKMDISRIPLLARGNLPAGIDTRNGFPVLDTGFQSSVPGLYFTSFPAAQDFGPFFGFTVSARVSATIIGAAIAQGR